MGARLGLRVGGFAAAVACALLVACGGGGGGGSVTPATPTPAPTASLAPAVQSTSAPITASVGGTANFGGVSSGGANVITGGTVTIQPGAFSANTTASVAMQATLPTGATTPAIRSIKSREAIGGTITNVLAYFTLSVAPSVSISQTPAFSLMLPNAITGTGYVAVFDLANASNGWNKLAGPVTASSNTISFPSQTLTPPFNLVAGDTYIFAVFTATNVPTPTPSPTVPPTATPSPAAATASPGAGATPGMVAGSAATLPPVTGGRFSGGGQAWSPSDVANAFQFPVQSGWDGTGRTIAIIGDVPPLTSDLTTYATRWQLPNNPNSHYSVVPVVGVSVQSPAPGDIDEATLDVETVMGLAPGATIQFYNTQGDLSNGAFLAAEQQVANANPDVFSISFGGCENYGPTVPAPAPTPADGPIFASMLANHVAVTVSAGDEGDNCSATATLNVFGLDYPGSDSSVISVGGTETDNGQGFAITAPQAWNDNAFSNGQGATGGGVSTAFTMPAWQKGIPGMYSYTYRNTPDISFPAEGIQLTLSGAQAVFGGTSWSAPEAAALMAELYEYCGARPANPIAELYNGWIANTNNFLDVNTGNNEWNATDSGITYAAHAGFDNNSGLGEPYGSPLGQSLCPGRAAWTKARVASAVPQMQLEQLGAARDTVMPYAQRYTQNEDLGERSASESTHATIVLRRTASMNSDARTVVATLQGAGMNVTWQNGALITFTAPSSTIGGYFRTSLHNVSQGKWGTRYTNVGPLTIPASIAPYVSTVFADTLVARKWQHHVIR